MTDAEYRGDQMTTPQRIEQLRQEYRNMLEYLGADVEAEMEAFDSKLHALLLSLQDELKNPTKIKQILESNMQERKIVDDLGFTGEYRLSEKQVLDVIIELINQDNG